MVHVHFDSDDEDMGGAAGAAMVPQPSTSVPPPAAGGHTSLPRCCASARVDFNFNDPCYVFRVVHSAATGMVASSISNNTIKLYQTAGESLSLVGELKGHTNNITGLEFDSESRPNTLLSSSADGTIRAWDTRTGQQAESYRVQGQELLCVTAREHMLCAGTNGEVLFWDRRNGRPLAKLDDTHMDDVTQVCFHASGRLVSGSIDGLIAVHDVSHSFVDDDVFQAALNINTSVEELGLFGADQHKLWVRTGTESVHLWEWLRATKDDVEGGDVPFAEFPDARGVAGQAAAASSVASLFPEVDYIVGCHYDAASDQALLVAGSNNGPVAFLPILEQRTPAGVATGAALACPAMALNGGHTSIVRSVRCFSNSTAAPFCVSGGEDALVCLWTLAPGGAGVGADAAAAGAGPALQRGTSPGPDRQHHNLPKKDGRRRPSPY